MNLRPYSAPHYLVDEQAMALTSAQIKVLHDLAAHAGEFRRGYGKSAVALVRRGLARRKFVSDDGVGFTAKFAITRSGLEAIEHDAR